MPLHQAVPPEHANPVPTLNAPVHRAEDLLSDSDTALIILNGMTYTLRRTRAGKLILTK
jgi:hemin uptake protein HemP